MGIAPPPLSDRQCAGPRCVLPKLSFAAQLVESHRKIRPNRRVTIYFIVQTACRQRFSIQSDGVRKQNEDQRPRALAEPHRSARVAPRWQSKSQTKKCSRSGYRTERPTDIVIVRSMFGPVASTTSGGGRGKLRSTRVHFHHAARRKGTDSRGRRDGWRARALGCARANSFPRSLPLPSQATRWTSKVMSPRTEKQRTRKRTVGSNPSSSAACMPVFSAYRLVLAHASLLSAALLRCAISLPSRA